jgi:hypothetical protein
MFTLSACIMNLVRFAYDKLTSLANYPWELLHRSGQSFSGDF